MKGHIDTAAGWAFEPVPSFGPQLSALLSLVVRALPEDPQRDDPFEPYDLDKPVSKFPCGGSDAPH